MSIDDLKPSDHSFGIDLNNISVKPKDLEKIQKAWSDGYFVFKYVSGLDFEHVGIGIFTVRSKCRAGKEAEEITKSWEEISKKLLKGEVPDEWVDDAIAKVSRRMEELL